MNNIEKYLAGSPFYLEQVLGLSLSDRAMNGKLSHLVLNQPPVCNSNCRRCFMPKSRRNNVANSLNLNECKKLLKDARENGIFCLEISGEGEPLLSENLNGIIQKAYDLGYTTTLITNGHKLTEEFIQFVYERNVTLIISLFSLEKELYEMDNNLPGSFDKLIEKIKHAASIYKGGISKVTENKEVYRFAIHTTAQSDNLAELTKIKSFCEDHSIFFSLAPLAPVGDGAEIRNLMVSENESIDVNTLGHNSIILSATSKEEIGREVCGTCLYGLNVGFDGNVLFDAHAGYEIGDLFGNIRNTPIDELIKKQREFAPYLFNNIDSFCPVRDPKWETFLQTFVENEVPRGV